MIYLDNAATTPVLQEVFDEMKDYFVYEYGNPEGKYYDLANNAKKGVELAKNRIAKFLNCNQNEITFNSGATEGNNTVIKGITDFVSKGTIITTRIEHSSISEVCNYVSLKGINIKYIDVNEYGKIILDDFINLLDTSNDVLLVTISFANSEMGTIQDVEKISEICYERNVPLHIDATQAVGKMHINLQKLRGVSFFTFSSHKLFGPKGVGALIKQKNKFNEYYSLNPLIHGSSSINQERPGTLNVPGIVGFGKACEMIDFQLDDIITSLKVKTYLLLNVFKDFFGERLILNNNTVDSVPGILNIRIVGINNELLLKSSSHLFAASTGSACSNVLPSLVLKNVGKSDLEISESIRLSINYFTPKEEILSMFNSLRL